LLWGNHTLALVVQSSLAGQRIKTLRAVSSSRILLGRVYARAEGRKTACGSIESTGSLAVLPSCHPAIELHPGNPHGNVALVSQGRVRGKRSSYG